jgi:hypothetical protein
MFREAAEALLTPCPRYARVMGYLDEVIGIGTRYRRCRAEWQPHLERTQEVIRAGMAQCTARRKAVIFGAGRLYDVPLEELAGAFEQVLLVDIVHPLSTRWTTRRFGNVQLLAADVTAVAEDVYRLGGSGGTLPVSRPTLLLDDAAVDYVASVNLLSQLPYTPGCYLRRWNRHSPQELEAFSRQLIEAHLDFLRRFRGVVSLSADVAYLYHDEQDRLAEETNALHGAEVPWPGEEWIWRLAPRRHNGGKTSLFHRVRGIVNLTSASVC